MGLRESVRRVLRPGLVAIVAGAALAGTGLVTAGPASAYTEAPEAYASYERENGCKETARPGTKRLARWINATFDGGTAVASVRTCDGSDSGHQEGRAIDWMMDAATKKDRQEVRRFFSMLFAADADDNAHALARRMGIMYLIWNDGMYSSYATGGAGHFERRDYGCGCGSKTARHRDHVHLSLSWAGARAQTSWYTESPDD